MGGLFSPGINISPDVSRAVSQGQYYNKYGEKRSPQPGGLLQRLAASAIQRDINENQPQSPYSTLMPQQSQSSYPASGAITGVANKMQSPSFVDYAKNLTSQQQMPQITQNYGYEQFRSSFPPFAQAMLGDKLKELYLKMLQSGLGG